MIACVIHGAHELKVENRPEPPRPQDGEVLVRFGAGGICGSDLHYYHEGGILDFKIREPLVLAHEVAGEVVEIGPGVTKVSVRDRVAVNPLRSIFWECRPVSARSRHVCGIIHHLGRTVCGVAKIVVSTKRLGTRGGGILFRNAI
jgi:threonine dehydrogenase-like Zn-dependent dehydrogenase